MPRQIIAWHLWRGDELFEITFEFKWKPPAAKGLLTNNLCPLNRFCLSKNLFTPSPSLFLTNNIKLDGMPTKTKWKIQACFILYFKFFEGTSVKIYMVQLPVLLFLVLHQFLYQQISFFYNVLELHSTLSEKKVFVTNFSFPTNSPKPAISYCPKSAKCDKSFCQFSLKCLLKYLFKKFIEKILQKHFFVSAVNCYCTYIFKGSNYRFPRLLFRTF